MNANDTIYIATRHDGEDAIAFTSLEDCEAFCEWQKDYYPIATGYYTLATAKAIWE